MAYVEFIINHGFIALGSQQFPILCNSMWWMLLSVGDAHISMYIFTTLLMVGPWVANGFIRGMLTLFMLGYFACLFVVLFLLVFVFKTFRNTIRVSTSLDPYQDQPHVELDLGPNCFQALSSADETSRKCVNAQLSKAFFFHSFFGFAFLIPTALFKPSLVPLVVYLSSHTS